MATFSHIASQESGVGSKESGVRRLRRNSKFENEIREPTDGAGNSTRNGFYRDVTSLARIRTDRRSRPPGRGLAAGLEEYPSARQ